MGSRWVQETAVIVGLNRRDRAVLRFIAEKANNQTGVMFWSQKKIAGETGWGERSIRYALASLEEAGWIERTRRHKDNGARRSDFIRVRTIAEGAAWVAARLDAGELDHVAPPVDQVAAPPPRERVNTPTRQPAFQGRRVDPAEARPLMRADNQAEETVPPDAIRLDLTRQLEALGHRPPADWVEDADPGKGRKVTG